MIGGAVLAVVVGAAVVVALVLRPGVVEGSPSTPTASVSESAVPAEQLDQLTADLHSGDPDTLSRALALPADEVTAEVMSGFAGLEIIWDTAATDPAENVDGEAMGWNVPAEVTQPDGTTSQWIVTVIPGKDGLIFLDSAEVPA